MAIKISYVVATTIQGMTTVKSYSTAQGAVEHVARFLSVVSQYSMKPKEFKKTLADVTEDADTARRLGRSVDSCEWITAGGEATINVQVA